MAVNPWHVKNLEDFTFICCPECIYKSKDAKSFECHALQNHPGSIDFFQIDKVSVVLETISNIDLQRNNSQPCVNESFKSEEEIECIPDAIKAEEIEPENNSDHEVFPDLESHGIEDLEEGNQVGKSENDLKETESIQKVSKEKRNENLTRCLICLNNCVSIKAKHEHIKVEHPKITCAKCREEFSDYKKLNIHWNNRHRTFKCDHCEKSLSCKSVLKQHILAFHVDDDKKQVWLCDECPFQTKTEQNLKIHKRYVHKFKRKRNKDLILPKELIDENGQIQCPKCLKKMEAVLYMRHYKKAHKCLPPHIDNSKKKYCEYCTAEFQLTWKLKRHIQTVHFKSKEEKTRKIQKTPRTWKRKEEEMSRCKLCNIDIHSKGGYIKHYRSFHKTLPPEYENCDTVFCDQCGKEFTDMKYLDIHIKYVHNKEKRINRKSNKAKDPIKCSYCPKTFTQKTNWLEHEKVLHEEVYNFKCEDCGRKFFGECKYKTHRQEIHDKVRCNICGKGPMIRFELANHKFQAHDIKPEAKYGCDICQKFYKTENKLAFHKSKVHKE